MAGMSEAGEEKAWEMIALRDPRDVARSASVRYDEGALAYLVASYGMDFRVSVKGRNIASNAAGSEMFLTRLGEFFRLSLLWYLAVAKDVPASGRLVRLENIRGGEAFSRGSHVLPLNRLAQKFGSDRNGFVEQGKRLGGEVRRHADAAVGLFPFPRVPVVIPLWLADEEFPARADLLFDSSCEFQLPPDIAWSVAMMSVLAMTM